MKTIDSMVHDSAIRQQYWLDAANSNNDLADLCKTRDEALNLASYYEGKYDAFIQARNLINKGE